jgi:hypothetical protein
MENINNSDNQCMNHDEFIQFLADQKNEIEKYKWIESEKVGHDLGNCAIMDWIHKYAKKYRDQYRQTH